MNAGFCAFEIVGAGGGDRGGLALETGVEDEWLRDIFKGEKLRCSGRSLIFSLSLLNGLGYFSPFNVGFCSLVKSGFWPLALVPIESCSTSVESFSSLAWLSDESCISLGWWWIWSSWMTLLMSFSGFWLMLVSVCCKVSEADVVEAASQSLTPRLELRLVCRGKKSPSRIWVYVYHYRENNTGTNKRRNQICPSLFCSILG